MRRRSWIAGALCLVLIGAVVNALVASACALLSKSRNEDFSTVRERPASFLPQASLWKPSREGLTVTEVSRLNGFGRTEYLCFEDNGLEPIVGGSAVDFALMRSMLLAGWPAPSLIAQDDDETHWWEGDGDELWSGWSYRVSWRGGLTVWRPSNPNWIPVRPWWPGFAVNTAFYGALAWVVLAGPLRLRRWRRFRRGLCMRCAYPMGAAGVCSECGDRMGRRSRMTRLRSPE